MLKAIQKDIVYYGMLRAAQDDAREAKRLLDEATYKGTRISTLVREAILIALEDKTTDWPNIIY